MITFKLKDVILSILIAVLSTLLILTGFGVFREEEPPDPTDLSSSDDFLPDSMVPALNENIPVPVQQGQNQFDREEWENISIYENYNDAVVNITTLILAYNFFLEPVPQEGGSGSGAIIDKAGIILTNYHVVESAQRVYVTLSDGTQHEGVVLGVDPENDLALVSFDPEGRELNVIPFGSSSDLRVGQKVLAIGNPYGLERTLTTGIVSGLGRPLRNREGHIIRDMIQTDASINPGNSGGPLLDNRGNLIGINTMIYSPSGGSVGIGFAVPVDTAKRVVSDLLEYGRVVRGWIDIEPVQLFPSLVRYAKLNVSQGMLVSMVQEGSFADEAGLKGGSYHNAVRSGNSVIYLGGDVIVEINELAISDFTDYYSALEDTRPGDKVMLTVVRGRRTIEMEIELSERPE